MPVRDMMFLLPLPFLMGAAPPAPFRYALDASRSDVSARVNFFGITSKTARFPGASGEIDLSPDRPDTVKLDVTLDASTLAASDTLTTSRLKGADFFDVAHYPQVRFTGRQLKMTGPETARLSGMLTAHGVTQSVDLDVTFAAPPEQADGLHPIHLHALTEIDRDAYGMSAYRLIVGRNVKISIDAIMVPVQTQ